MYDYIRRLLIVMAVALSIGILFISANVSFAETNNNNDYIWPTEGVVTDTFGTRKGKHYGIDIAAPRGTTVVAVSDGVVSKSYYSSTYGHVIFIDHSDGFETVYAHLHKRLVEEGDVIYQGEKIGVVGNTGRSSGDHLHFEMHEGNWTTSKKNAIDPMVIIGDKENFFVLSDEAIEKSRYQVASVSHTMEQEEQLLDDEAFYITVKKGESLWSIANGYQVSVDQLINWNNLSSDQVKIDQKLKIVPRGKYIVQRGDTLWKIAEQSGTTVSRIKKLNGLKGDVIQIGTLLDVVN